MAESNTESFSIASLLASSKSAKKVAPASSADSVNTQALSSIFSQAPAAPLVPVQLVEPEAEADGKDSDSDAEFAGFKRRNAERMKKNGEKEANPERDARTVFVANVSVAAKPQQLKALFAPFGTIESVRFRSIAFDAPKLPKRVAFAQKAFHTSRDSCHAYVVFKEAAEAQKAAEAVRGSLFMSKHLHCTLANDTNSDTKRTVFVGNLPFDVEDETVWRLFLSLDRQDGDAADQSVDGVRIVRDGASGLGKGFAFVSFVTSSMASDAIRAFHNKEVDLGEFVENGEGDKKQSLKRTLRVFRAVKDADKAKQLSAKSRPGQPETGKGGRFNNSGSSHHQRSSHSSQGNHGRGNDQAHRHRGDDRRHSDRGQKREREHEQETVSDDREAKKRRFEGVHAKPGDTIRLKKTQKPAHLAKKKKPSK